jgi:hypothetical protein
LFVSSNERSLSKAAAAPRAVPPSPLRPAEAASPGAALVLKIALHAAVGAAALAAAAAAAFVAASARRNKSGSGGGGDHRTTS